MKKAILSLLAILILLSACGRDSGEQPTAEPKSSPDLVTLYAPVLESWGKAIAENGGYGADGDHDGAEYPFVCLYLPNEFAEAQYAYYDIDSNGVPELLLASVFDFGYYHLIDVFTVHEGLPVRLFEGVEDRGFWSRNRLDFSYDGASLIVEGSSGAAYTTTDFYRIAENGYQVELLEGLATYHPEKLDDDTPQHRLSDGTYEAATDFDGVMEKYYGQKYLTRNETYDYASDFHTQLDWKPIVQAVPLAGIVTIPIEGTEYRPSSMPELLEVTIAEESILSDHTLADGTGLCWYLDGASAACAYRKPGGVWVRFLVEDSAYRDGFGFGAYDALFGHSGFTVTAPRGLAYFAYDYYYLDETGTPCLLFGGTYLDQIGDFNGDGGNELLGFYHGGEMASYHYLQDGRICAYDITAALRLQFPGWNNICVNPIPQPDKALQVSYSVDDAECALQLRFTAENMVVSAAMG